ncbi:hypothetical protein C8F01DRAFT_1135061 [Mycena amicta]|nr:hypothetical protein C8F01DRAFT_1135061 [Mycena amicta]
MGMDMGGPSEDHRRQDDPPVGCPRTCTRTRPLTTDIRLCVVAVDASSSSHLRVPASNKVKRVDYYFSRWGKQWKYKNMNSKVTVETLPILGGGNSDPWKEYSFSCSSVLFRRRRIASPHSRSSLRASTSSRLARTSSRLGPVSPGTLTLLRWSWKSSSPGTQASSSTAMPWSCAARKTRTEQENNIMSSVTTLLSFLATDYRSTLAQIARLTAHGEITYDLLYAILVPRTLIVARCAVTGLERLFRLESFTHTAVEGVPVYALALEGVDLVDRPMTQTVGVGRVQANMFIPYFKGAARIDTLDAYPLRFHPNETQVVQMVKQRGQKWVGLLGIHHQEYNGIAAVKAMNRVVRHQVKGRIMVDRGTYAKNNPNYPFPTPAPPKAEDGTNGNPNGNPFPRMQYDVYGQPIMMQPPVAGQGFGDGALVHAQAEASTENKELTEEELLLTPTVVYGFSLSDKMWLGFDVTKVQPVQWNEDVFANLVLPTDRKVLLQSLVEAHHQESGFDDFVKGKGAGLVVDLFGPPGVGKRFSAEATSEHVKRPLYVIGGGDLGTRAADLDVSLERVFNVATAWKAIVLIDEADVFLERRSLHDLERNAMVAVFLRHVEYYRGILFLTTNRVQAFDEALLSRIHVALHFSDLTESSRAQVWRAFIARAGVTIVEEDIALLAKREVNGRQIKNAVRTAHSLALAKKEAVGFGHILQTLDAMDEFTAQFEGMKASET